MAAKQLHKDMQKTSQQQKAKEQTALQKLKNSLQH